MQNNLRFFAIVPCNKESDLKDRGCDGKSDKAFPLTARRIDMGNTMRIDMGNTFCALRRPATHFLREAELLHTSSQTPSIGPLGACDEVCSSSCGTGEISLQTIEVLPMCVLKVLPMSMRATHPSPLPRGEGEPLGSSGRAERANGCGRAGVGRVVLRRVSMRGIAAKF